MKKNWKKHLAGLLVAGMLLQNSSPLFAEPASNTPLVMTVSGETGDGDVIAEENDETSNASVEPETPEVSKSPEDHEDDEPEENTGAGADDQEDESLTEETTAGAEETTAAAEETTAAAEETPATKEESAAAEEETSETEQELPAADEETKAADEETQADEEETSAVKEETTAAEEETTAAGEAAEITYTEDGIPIIPESMLPAQSSAPRRARLRAGAVSSDVTDNFSLSVTPSASARKLTISYLGQDGQSHDITFPENTYDVSAVYTAELVSYQESDGVTAAPLNDADAETLSGDFLKIEITRLTITASVKIVINGQELEENVYTFIPESISQETPYALELKAELTDKGSEKYYFRKLDEEALVSNALPYVCTRLSTSDQWKIDVDRLHLYDATRAASYLPEPAYAAYLIGLDKATSEGSKPGETKYNALLFYCQNSNLQEMPTMDAQKLAESLFHTKEFFTKQTVDGKEKQPYIETIPLEYTPEASGASKESFKKQISDLAEALTKNGAIDDDDCVTMISWTGHGSFDSGGNQSYICLGNTEEDYMSGAELRKTLSELPGRVIFLTDACFSGGLLNTASTISLFDETDEEETGASFESKEQYAAALTECFAEEFLYGKGGDGAVLSDDADTANSSDSNARYQMLLTAQSVETGMYMGTAVGGAMANSFCLAFAYDGTTLTDNDGSYHTFAADYNRDGVITMSELATMGEYSAASSTPVYYPSDDEVTPVLHCLPDQTNGTDSTDAQADGQSTAAGSDGENPYGASFEVLDYDDRAACTKGNDGSYDVIVNFNVANKLSQEIILCAYAGQRNADPSDYYDARFAMQSSYLTLADRYGCFYVGEVKLEGKSHNDSNGQTKSIDIKLKTDDPTAPLYIYLQLKKSTDSQDGADTQEAAQTKSSASPYSGGTQFMVLRVTLKDSEQKNETLKEADIESMAIELPSSAQYGSADQPYTISLTENEDDDPSPLAITYRFAEDREGGYYENRYADCVATMSVYQLSSGDGTPAVGTGTGTGSGGADPGDGTFMLNLFAGRRMHWRRQDIDEAATSAKKISYGTGETSWDLMVTGSDGKRKRVNPGTYLLKFTATYNSETGNEKTSKTAFVYLNVTSNPNTTSDKLINRTHIGDNLLSLWYRNGNNGEVTAGEIADRLKTVVSRIGEGTYGVESVSIYGLTDQEDISDNSIWKSELSDKTELKAVADDGSKYLATKTVLAIPEGNYRNGYRFSENLRLDVLADAGDHKEVHYVSADANANPLGSDTGTSSSGASEEAPGRYLIVYQLHPLETEKELIRALTTEEEEEIGIRVDGRDMGITELLAGVVYTGSRIQRLGGTQLINLWCRTGTGNETMITQGSDEVWTVPTDATELIVGIKLDSYAKCQFVKYSIPVKSASEGRGFVLESAPEKRVYVVGEQPNLSTATYSYNGVPVPASEVETNWEEWYAEEASAYAVSASYMGQTLKDAFDLIYYATQMMSKADGVSFSRSRSGLYESVDPDSVYLAVTPTYIDYAESAGGQELLVVNYAFHFYRMDGSKPDPAEDTEVYPVSGSFSRLVSYPSELANGYNSFDKMAFVSAVQGANALSVTAEEGGLRLSGGSSGEVTVTFRLQSQPTPSGSSSGGSSASDRAKGWVRVGTLRGDSYTYGWKYLGTDGRYVTGTRTPGADGAPGELIPAWVQTPAGGWYAFDENGWLITGWLYDPTYSGWFYIDETAGAYLGWHEIGGKWYYFDDAESAGLWQSYVARMAENRLIDGLYQVGPDGDWDGKSAAAN